MTFEMMDFGWRALLGIAAGGLSYFFLGALWYMKLFSKRWIVATGRSPEDFKDGSPGAGLLLTLGGCVVATAVLALVYEWAGGSTMRRTAMKKLRIALANVRLPATPKESVLLATSESGKFAKTTLAWRRL